MVAYPMLTERAHHLPRLSAEAYRGHCLVHWTMTVANRAIGWLDEPWYENFRILLKEQTTAHAVCVPAYCVMPDHVHLLGAGMALDADQRRFIRALRREMNVLLSPYKLQKQPYDHVLCPNESGADAFAALAHYIAENPVRAGLVREANQWPFTGTFVRGLPLLDPRNADFRETWWAYWNARVGR